MQRQSIFKIVAGFIIVSAAIVFFAVRLAGLRSKELAPAARVQMRDSAADAVSLIPASGTVVGIERLDGNVFWVGQKNVVDANESSYRELQRSWIVNTDLKTASKLSETEFGFPGASATSTPFSDSRYLVVKRSAGWEGSLRERQEYIDRKTGELSYAFESENDRLLRARRGNDEVRITFDPADPCGSDGERTTSTVIGVRIDETAAPFNAPREIECVPNDMTGESSSPSFASFELISEGRLRAGFSWGGALLLPADTFDAGLAEFVD